MDYIRQEGAYIGEYIFDSFEEFNKTVDESDRSEYKEEFANWFAVGTLATYSLLLYQIFHYFLKIINVDFLPYNFSLTLIATILGVIGTFGLASDSLFPSRRSEVQRRAGMRVGAGLYFVVLVLLLVSSIGDSNILSYSLSFGIIFLLQTSFSFYIRDIDPDEVHLGRLLNEDLSPSDHIIAGGQRLISKDSAIFCTLITISIMFTDVSIYALFLLNKDLTAISPPAPLNLALQIVNIPAVAMVLLMSSLLSLYLLVVSIKHFATEGDKISTSTFNIGILEFVKSSLTISGIYLAVLTLTGLSLHYTIENADLIRTTPSMNIIFIVVLSIPIWAGTSFVYTPYIFLSNPNSVISSLIQSSKLSFRNYGGIFLIFVYLTLIWSIANILAFFVLAILCSRVEACSTVYWIALHLSFGVLILWSITSFNETYKAVKEVKE